MKKIISCLTVLLTLATMSSSMFAQNAGFTVKGTVSDKNGPIPGAGVVLKNTRIGTLTDADGAYQLTIPGSREGVLEFSFLGYVTQEIKVTEAEPVVNVILQEEAVALESVVVLGFGASQRKADLSTSVGVLSNVEENKNRPVSSIENILQGQIPGVTVMNDGGDPTSAPSVTIRGVGSRSYEAALWVVDGVPGAPFQINDVESIVILKDAASSAIYGAQSGASGVILVTTKKARAGAPAVSYEGNYGIRQPWRKLQSLTIEQERDIRTQSYANSGVTLDPLWKGLKTRTNWVDEVFRNAFYQRHQVALNGGTDKFTTRIALNINDDQGTLLDTYNKSVGVRFNAKYDLTKHVSITEDATWSSSRNRGEATGLSTSEGYTGILFTALAYPQSAVVYNPDGTFGGTADDSATASLHSDLVNPVRLLTASTVRNKYNNFSSTTALQVHDLLVPGLKFNSRFTYRASNSFHKDFMPRIPELGKPSAKNTLTYSTSDFYFWETENSLTYDQTFAGKHNVGALLATTASEQRNRGFGMEGKYFDSELESDQYISYAGEKNVEDWYSSPDNNVALVARLSYSFDDRYFVTGSWRRDYAGRLPKGNKSADFPAATVGWKISSEPFFPENDYVNLLKIRASWGRIGNLSSVGYCYGYPMLKIQGSSDGSQVGTQGSNTNSMNMTMPNVAVNPDLTWETSEQTDLGLDADLFDSRLSLSADWFYKRTFNLIQEQPTNWPEYIGINPMLVNQGEIRNTGVELSINWKDRVSQDFSYYVGGNIATLKNWVSNIGIINEDGTTGTWNDRSHFRYTLRPFRTAQGEPVNSYWLLKTDGLFQSDAEAANYKNAEGKVIQPKAKAGDLKFIDYNGDGRINDDDRQYMGSYLPKFTYALNAGFKYKDLTFSMMLQGVGKTKAFNAAKFITCNEAEGAANRSTQILDAWSPDNPDGKIPRLSIEDANENFQWESDFYLEDASYLRLKNVTVSYDFSRLLRKCESFRRRGSSFSMFLSGENLLTLTKYSGWDPEVGGNGLDGGRYPVSRVFSVGIKLNY